MKCRSWRRPTNKKSAEAFHINTLIPAHGSERVSEWSVLPFMFFCKLKIRTPTFTRVKNETCALYGVRGPITVLLLCFHNNFQLQCARLRWHGSFAFLIFIISATISFSLFLLSRAHFPSVLAERHSTPRRRIIETLSERRPTFFISPFALLHKSRA